MRTDDFPSLAASLSLAYARESLGLGLYAKCTKLAVRHERRLYGKGSNPEFLDVGIDPASFRYPPVSFGHGANLLQVSVGVVVIVKAFVPIKGSVAALEVAGGSGYGVFGVHSVDDPVALSVNPGVLPPRGRELHRSRRAGAGGTHVRAVI